MVLSFVMKKLFNRMQSCLLILAVFSCAPGVLVRKSLPMLLASSVCPVFPSSGSKVSGLILRSLIHFELIFVQRFSSSLLHQGIAPLKEAVFSPVEACGPLSRGRWLGLYGLSSVCCVPLYWSAGCFGGWLSILTSLSLLCFPVLLSI